MKGKPTASTTAQNKEMSTRGHFISAQPLLKSVFYILLLFPFLAARSQPGALDLSFNPGLGTNHIVNALALQPDGKVVAVGGFSNFAGVSRKFIGRAMPSGTIDFTFDPGTSTIVAISTVALQPNGKILIGGDFPTFQGMPRSGIARLNEDGSLDQTFSPGSGLTGRANTIVVQPDGKILIGGSFSHYNGTPRGSLARVNSDGSLDTTFDAAIGATGGAAPSIHTMVLQPDGRIVIGGQFENYSNVPRKNVARVLPNGGLDTTFNPGTGAYGGTYAWVKTTCLQPDGKILIGGDFTVYNGMPQGYFTRVHPDGVMDTSFHTGTGADWDVNAIVLQADSSILVGGDFWNINGKQRLRIARLHPDGMVDTTFDPGSGANGAILSMVVQPDSAVLLGGVFSLYDGTSRNYIARINGGDLIPLGIPASSPLPQSLDLYPNPAGDALWIHYETDKAQSSIIRLLDMTGLIIKTVRVSSRIGSNTFQIDLGELPSGTYTVQVLQNNQLSHTGKVEVRK